jgi:hypothetical protein
MIEELSDRVIKGLEEYVNELIIQYSTQGPEDSPKRMISSEIDRIKLIAGDRRYSNKRYMIEYEVFPKRLKGLFYRNLVSDIEKDLSSFVGSSVHLLEY